MMRQSVRSSRNGRIIAAFALALPALLVSASPARAVPSPMRYQNFHGSSCEAFDTAVSHPIYGNGGVTITNTAGGTTSMLACPVTWSLDSTTFPLLEIYLTVSWSGAQSSFEPGCMFTMNTNSSISGGLFIVPFDHTINPGTPNPTQVFHWKAADPTVAPVMYQNVIGSLVSCINVPSGVVLNGYSVTTCISNNTSNCSF